MWYIGDIPVVERSHGLVVTTLLFTSLAFLAVGMRIFTRVLLVRNAGADDYFIIVAMLGAIAFLVGAMMQIKFGLGDAVHLDTLPSFLKSLYVTIVSYGITHTAVKFSIICQCKRIFTERSAQRLFLGLIIWLSLYGSFCVLSSMLTCIPVAKYWDDRIPGGCMDRSNLHYALAGFNILNDIVIWVAPLPFLRKLQMAKRAKIVLVGVFACAGFACIVAIIRLHSLYVNNSAPIDQQPIHGVDIAIWSCLEINIAIICASVPALKPLFTKVFPRLIGSTADSYKRSRTNRSATHGTQPVRSVKRSRAHDDEDSDGFGSPSPGITMGIQIEQSFEMKDLPADGDDGSEKNLVTCYATPRHENERERD